MSRGPSLPRRPRTRPPRALSAARLSLQRIRRDWWLNTVAASPLIPSALRVRLLRQAGMTIGADAVISPRCFIEDVDVRVGRAAYIGYECILDGSGQVVIGDEVELAYRVTLLTATHDIGLPARRAGEVRQHDVRIGDGTWVGANATILPGADIGEGCVIAAGAVVHGKLDPHGVFAGVPARRVRDLPSDGAGG